MSNIEWTDVTWNPVAGCQHVHDGCRNCYAERMTHRLASMPGTKAKYDGLTVVRDGRPHWTGEFREWPEHLDQPLKWKKARKVFVNSMSDLFGEGVSNEYIAAVFAVMAACPQHRFLVLTKRPQRALEWDAWLRNDAWPEQVTPDELNPYAAFQLSDGSAGSHEGIVSMLWNAQRAAPAGWDSMWTWPLPNVAIGVSVSDQRTWDDLVPLLLEIPARWRIVSAEPLLSPIETRSAQCAGHSLVEYLNQVIIGAESGPGARPCKLEWVQGLAAQVLDAQTTCLECDRGHEHTCFEGMAGPALFIKQADVCARCEGKGWWRATAPNNPARFGCQDCGGGGYQTQVSLNSSGEHVYRRGTGQAGKVRKGSPEVWIPGHGTQSWQQFPQGWV